MRGQAGRVEDLVVVDAQRAQRQAPGVAGKVEVGAPGGVVAKKGQVQQGEQPKHARHDAVHGARGASLGHLRPHLPPRQQPQAQQRVAPDAPHQRGAPRREAQGQHLLARFGQRHLHRFRAVPVAQQVHAGRVGVQRALVLHKATIEVELPSAQRAQLQQQRVLAQAVADAQPQAQPADAGLQARRQFSLGPAQVEFLPAAVVEVGPGPGGVVADVVAPAFVEHQPRGG